MTDVRDTLLWKPRASEPGRKGERDTGKMPVTKKRSVQAPPMVKQKSGKMIVKTIKKR